MKKVYYSNALEKGGESSKYFYTYSKRAIDIMVSLSLLVCLAPLLCVFALAIIITSGRPILFRQTRSGLNGTRFEIWKFRTMENIKNLKSLHSYDWSNGVPHNFCFEKPASQKVTRIGKVYRKLSIDELPQLLNVLRGEMSLVGPRPEIVEITGLYNDQQAKRLTVKPGITGYAQVNGRSIITHGEKIEYDLYYIHNRSFILDVKVILNTIVLVIRGKGAY
ncbi:sugar transferase [Sporosarcina sp.]|uniref:sugar transferase n=1 Tax=Sporosarcina sp. TaxID=49982 RepID=UPI002622A707|nr:sugar transferase [Sporosarcina sp.]